MEIMEETPISKTDEIIKNAKISAEAGGAGFMDPQPKVSKGKRGRPPGSKSEKRSSLKDGPVKEPGAAPGPEKTAFSIPSSVLCIPLVKGVSVAAVAYTRDSRSAMLADEAEAMANAMGMVMDKWMPDMVAKWGPELALGICASQYGLRLYALKKQRDAFIASKMAEKAAADAANKTPPGSANAHREPLQEFPNDLGSANVL